MKRKLLWCCLALCILWTAFVFSRSAKSGADSSAESGAVLSLVEQLCGALNMENPLSERFLRKLGHFLEYFVLGALAFPSARRFLRRQAPLAALGYAVAVALLDEFFVQNLSVGRGPSLLDVGIDTAGALAAILLCLALFLRKTGRTRSRGACLRS